MEHTLSTRPDNIFYGDFAIINGKGCAVFGYGKTAACRVAATIDDDDKVDSDFLCLTNDKFNNLYGHLEFPVRSKKVNDPIEKRTKIHFMLRMMSKEETELYFHRDPLEIKEINYKSFVQFSRFNITFISPNSLFPGFPETETNPDKRIENFINLTSQAETKQLIVPFMESAEEKGELLKQYFHSLN